MKITIDHSIIKALLVFAAKNDLRYYLNSIAIDATRDRVALVATDGHMLMSIAVPASDVDNKLTGEYIISRADLEAVKPMKAGKHALPITIEITEPAPTPDPDRAGVMIKHNTTYKITGLTSVTNTLVDGKFPDWRRVIPPTLSGEVAHFNLELITRLNDARKALSVDWHNVVIHHNGRSAAQVTGLGNESIVIVMPMRVDSDDKPMIPAWAKLA